MPPPTKGVESSKPPLCPWDYAKLESRGEMRSSLTWFACPVCERVFRP